MSITFFDSRDTHYRSPFGAVAEGTGIHFRICLPRHIGCSAATLVIHNEMTGERETGNMFWCGMEGSDAEWWEVDYTPDTASLYFYWFELSTNSSVRALGRTWGGKGELTGSNPPTAWQLTVYERDFATPDWLDGGIMYQIFPDSFCRSGNEHPDIPADRIYQEWGEQPHWQPDENGRITNRRYFGGDLDGIRSKLDYIASLGVTCIYLNPIFEAHENHRYNTGDYSKIDPMLGDEKSFRALCREAKERGMHIILDGVFSHTGCDSKYFNQYGRYDSVGAYNSRQSEYYSWYKFGNWPDKFDSWWGITTLPELHEEDPGVLRYLTGEDGIVRKWIGAGASGWRLDVADELPDIFLDSLRAAAKAQKSDALIIGEVWEDASNKTAYSQRRRYLLGKQLDSVMNYCFKDAILGFLTGMDGAASMEIIMNVLENYPPQVTRLLMNLVGTHDTERVITMLAGEPSHGQGRPWQASHRLSDEQRALGRERYKLATVLQYTLPGVPSIYYGDETGVEGYRDPFNRACYPWGSEDAELIEWHRTLGRIRASLDCLRGAGFAPLEAHDRLISYIREGERDKIIVAVNAGDYEYALPLPEDMRGGEYLIGESRSDKYICVPAGQAIVIRRRDVE